MKSKYTKRTEALERRTRDAEHHRAAIEFWGQAKREDLTMSGLYKDTDPQISKVHESQATLDADYVAYYTRKLAAAERDINNLMAKLGIEEKGA